MYISTQLLRKISIKNVLNAEKLGIIILVASVMLMPQVVHAARSITLPFTESFDSTSYSGDMLWVANQKGAQHIWRETGGWSGGASEFVPPINDEGNSGLGGFVDINPNNGGNVTQINVRFLIYHSRGFVPAGSGVNKLVIVRKTVGDRPMLLSNYAFNNNERYVSYGPCDGTVCSYQNGNFWPGNDDLRIGDTVNSRNREWISMEYEVNTVTGMTKLYVYTTDGQIAGVLAQKSIQTGGFITDVDIIGGYFGNASNMASTATDNFFRIDELKIDRSYIGPPAGFLSDPPPSSPGIDDVRN